MIHHLPTTRPASLPAVQRAYNEAIKAAVSLFDQELPRVDQSDEWRGACNLATLLWKQKRQMEHLRFWSEAKFCYEEWRAQLGNDEIIPKSMPPWLYIDKIIRV